MAEPATTAAEAEAGVLRSLLEEGEDPPGGDAVDISIMAKDVPATSSAPASTANVALVPIDVELNTLVAQQHAAAHQARAAAALEQADAAEERQHQDQQQQQQQQQYNQVPTSPQLQQQQQQQHVTLAANSPPLTLSAQDSHRQPAESVPQTAPIVIPSATADMEDETSLTPGPPDLTLSSVPSSMNICLCQQPARIPRPRNAFILYRQHNQAAVVAHHPGKPNPEISKIIGEMWRTSSEEVKKIWQKHADDEKKQHLLRYPDYRYQPRRNGKKNAAAAAAAFSSAGGGGALSPSIETTICSLCGGRTGTLSTPQTPGTPSSAVPKTPRLPPPPHISRPPSTAPPPAKKRRTGSSEDPVPQTSPGGGSASGVGVVDQAGVEALLQLGHLQNEDESNAVVTELQTPVKKRKLNEGSPMTGIIGSNSLSHSFYNHLSQSAGDPNIDPFLRHNGIESESPTTTTTLDHEGNLTTTTHYHQLPNFTSQLPDTYMMKPIPALEKINAFNKICKPLPSMSGPGFARLPIVAIEGEDIETVAELFHALAKDIRKSEPIHVIDEPEIFAPTIAEETADIEGLLIPNSLDSTSPALVPVSSTKDKDRHDNEDDAAARYLSHVASWRRRCVEIKKAVTSPPGADGTASVTMAFGEDSAGDAPSVVLVNRYMVSRSDLAAARLAPDGLSPLQHWQWCATVWRGCVGPDMTIYVNPMPEGGVRSEEAVEVRDSGRVVFVRKEEGVRKEWDEKIVRRLGFEVGEVVRSLRGFGG